GAARIAAREEVAIAEVIRRLRRAQPGWKRTAVAGESGDPFRVLIACLLSLRTQDTTTGPAAARLFALADTPWAMLELSVRRIEAYRVRTHAQAGHDGDGGPLDATAPLLGGLQRPARDVRPERVCPRLAEMLRVSRGIPLPPRRRAGVAVSTP